MSTVHIAEKKIWVDDVAIPLLSGEIHYWRLDPANWRPVLQRAREMGLQVIATYVCWDFHEIEPGRYDFRGETDPRRDLLGFLDLLTAEGFWIILRPGPYIYSEWRNNGVPDDAARLHRLDPAFRARALPYMHAVVEAVCPYLATHGGRIILWQAEGRSSRYVTCVSVLRAKAPLSSRNDICPFTTRCARCWKRNFSPDPRTTVYSNFKPAAPFLPRDRSEQPLGRAGCYNPIRYHTNS